MSVAAHLANVTIPAATKRAPSLFQAPHPRTEAASTALNNLEVLSTIDSTLPALSEDLLLYNPTVDRTTLPKETLQKLSNATITLFRRLSPILPLRPAQLIVEWPIAHLHLDRFGTDKEINALLLGALPFHSTPFFLQLIRSLQNCLTRHTNWQWLLPFARKQSNPSISQIASLCPASVLQTAIQECVQSHCDNISNPHLPNLVAAVGSLRLSNPSTPNRRQLALAVVSAVADIVAQKDKQNQVFDDTACSLLTCISVTITAGVPDDVGPALAHAVLAILRAFDLNSPICSTAALALVLVTQKLEPSVLPVKSLSRSLADGHLASSLLTISHTKGIADVYANCMLVLANGQLSKTTIKTLQKALAIESEILLPSSTVEKVIAATLALASEANLELEEKRKQSVMKHLAALLSPLARGRFAKAIDAALRKHFSSRSGKKSHKKKYVFVDEAISLGLHQTQFEVIKIKSMENEDSPSSTTVLASLEHPEPAVRKAAAQRVHESNLITQTESQPAKEQLLKNLDYILEEDKDIEVVTIAGKCVLQAGPDNVMSRLRVLLGRFAEETKSLSKKKKAKSLENLRELFSVILSLTEMAPSNESFNIHTALLGIFTCDLLPEEGIDVKQRIANILENLSNKDDSIPVIKISNTSAKSFKEIAHDYLQSLLSESDCSVLSKVFESMKKWSPSWALQLLQFWFKILTTGDKVNSIEDSNRSFLLDLSTSLYEQYAELRNQILIALLSVIPTMCNVSTKGTVAVERARTIWRLMVKESDPNFAEDVASKIVETQSLDVFVHDILRETCAPDKTDDASAQKCSLKWYISLCAIHPSSKFKKNACVVILQCFYGGNPELIAEIRRISALEVGSKKRKGSGRKDCEVKALLRLISTLSDSTKSTVDTNTTDVLREVVTENVRLVQSQNLPPALSFRKETSPIVSEVFESVLEHITKQKESDSVPFKELRAIANYQSRNEDTTNNMLTFLDSILEKLQETASDPCTNLVESIALTIKLLTAAQPGSFSKAHLCTTARRALDFFTQLVRKEEDRDSIEPSVETICVMLIGFLVSNLCTDKNVEPKVKQGLLGFGLFFSTNSTRAGTCMRQILDNLFSKGLHLQDIEIFVQNISLRLNSSSKKIRLTREGVNPALSAVVNETAEAAIDVLRRILPSMRDEDKKQEIASLHKIRQILWDCVNLVEKRCRNSKEIIGDDLEYEIAGVLNTLTEIHRMIPSKVEVPSLHSLVEIVFFPRRDYDGAETGLIVTVRRSALDLLETVASIQGSDLQSVISPIIETLLCTSETTKSLNALQRLIPSLFKSGCKLDKICTWLTTAAYGDRPERSVLEKRRSVLASCGWLVPDPYAAFTSYFKCIDRMIGDTLDEEQAARECALLLQVGELPLMTDLRLLRSLGNKLRHAVVASYVITSSFAIKLEEVNESKEIDDASLAASARDLFMELLETGMEKEVEKSAVTLLSVTPIAVMETYIVSAIESNNKQLQRRALQVLSEFLQSHESIPCSWGEKLEESWSNKRQRTTLERKFLENVGNSICSLTNSDKMISQEEPDVLDLARIAIDTLEQLVLRMGLSNADTLETFSQVLALLIEQLGTSIAEVFKHQSRVTITLSILNCSRAIITNLRKISVRLTPQVLTFILNLLDHSFGRKQSVPGSKHTSKSQELVTETCLRTLTVIFDYAPSLVGSTAIERLGSLQCNTNTSKLVDVLRLAVTRVSTKCAVQGLSNAAKKLQKGKTHSDKIRLLLKTMTIGIGSMEKSETKLYADSFLQTGLTCVEQHRSTSSILETNIKALYDHSESAEQSESSHATRNRAVDDQALDESCAEMVATLIMKLSETEFKKVYKNLVQWSNEGTLPGNMNDICDQKGISIEKNITRTVPFLRITRVLFERLQRIFIPYFLQIHDRIISTIGQKIEKFEPGKDMVTPIGKGTKKRSRHVRDLDEHDVICEHLSDLQSELKTVCLENLVLFLRQDLDANMLSTAMVALIQENLLTMFDDCEGEAELIDRCLIGLSTRIVGLGSVENGKEESRQLLVGLSRAILSRTQQDDTKLRKNALRLSVELASNVGDEYLVTLPECMPVLAEVIDDEDESVRKEARRFVQVMETLAGESILDQLE